MITSRILWRLYAGYVAIILISTIIVGLLVGQQVASNGMDEIEKSLTIQSEMLAELSRSALARDVTTKKTDDLQETI